MKASDKTPVSLRVAQLASALIALSALVEAGALAYPLHEGWMYTGAPVVFAGMSLLCCLVFNLIAFPAVVYVHFKHQQLQQHAWFVLLAGEFLYITFFLTIGTIFEYMVRNSVAFDWAFWLLFAAAIASIFCAKKSHLTEGLAIFETKTKTKTETETETETERDILQNVIRVNAHLSSKQNAKVH